MKIEDILKLSRREALNYADDLDKAYFEISGRHFCRVCPADITTMLGDLTRKYINMTQFRLKKERAVYRIKKGSSVNIKNDTMTDDLAIQFLQENPQRIELFSEYPKDWKKLVNGEEEPCDDCLKAELSKLKLKELKEKYPTIQVEFGQKKSEFIDKVIEQESNKE